MQIRCRGENSCDVVLPPLARIIISRALLGPQLESRGRLSGRGTLLRVGLGVQLGKSRRGISTAKNKDWVCWCTALGSRVATRW